MTTEGKTMSDEVQITNHRADAAQNESLIGMARMGADAFGYRAGCASIEAWRNSCGCGSHNSTTAPTASTSTTRPPATLGSRARSADRVVGDGPPLRGRAGRPALHRSAYPGPGYGC